MPASARPQIFAAKLMTRGIQHGLADTLMKARRTALYLRVSTDGQTAENQRLVLEA